MTPIVERYWLRRTDRPPNDNGSWWYMCWIMSSFSGYLLFTLAWLASAPDSSKNTVSLKRNISIRYVLEQLRECLIWYHRRHITKTVLPREISPKPFTAGWNVSQTLATSGFELIPWRLTVSGTVSCNTGEPHLVKVQHMKCGKGYGLNKILLLYMFII